jgi:hypothetical protein
MSPITNSFEDRLLDALLDRFDTMANHPAAAPASLPRRAGIRRGTVAVGCLAATAALVVVVLEAGGSVPAKHVGSASQRINSSTPAHALAAWTSQPTSADQTQIAAAENHCSANFSQAGAPQATPGQKEGPPEAGGPWSPELVDTRGDLTLTLYSDGTRSMACLNSPSFVQILTVSGTGAPPVADNSATLDYMSIRGASGDTFTVAVGQSGSAVSGVGLQLNSGSVVSATVGNGHFIAWWPEGGGVSALSVTTTSGTQSYPVNQRFLQPTPQPSNKTVHELTGAPGQ